MNVPVTTGPLEVGEVDRARVLAASTGTAVGDPSAWRADLADPGRLVLGCRVGEDLVGVARLLCVADEAEVLELAVAPSHRRRGYGRLLVRAALAAASEAGAVRVLLEVRSDNHGAVALYRGVGFTQVGRRPAYYADGTDAVLLAAPAG